MFCYDNIKGRTGGKYFLTVARVLTKCQMQVHKWTRFEKQVNDINIEMFAFYIFLSFT